MSAKIQTLEVKNIVPDANQPRKYFAADKMRSLKESIKKHGIKQPVVVEDGGAGKFLLIDGERRFRAAQELGLKEIPALVEKPQTKVERLVVQFNIQENHEGWTPVEKAVALTDISQEMGVTMKEATELLSIPYRVAQRYMAFAGLVDKEAYIRSELPLDYVQAVRAVRVNAANIYEKATKDTFTRTDEKKFEARIIEQIKSGEIKRSADIGRMRDTFKKSPKLIRKFLDTKTSVNSLYKEAGADSMTALRQAVSNANYLKMNANIYMEKRDAVPTEYQVRALKEAKTAITKLIDSFE